MKTLIRIIAFLSITSQIQGQPIVPNLQDQKLWKVTNREVSPISEKGGVYLSEKKRGGMMMLKDVEFQRGTIELDIKGVDKLQQSFVGIAFHIQDSKTFECVYFRPFNFRNVDISKRGRAVQYISLPKYDWPDLRKQFPGKFEHPVNPAPDPNDWFHAKIKIEEKQVLVFVDHATEPSLTIERLSSHNKGRIGLWVGFGSGGSFANLVITPESL